jgi:hypothetical protein
VANEHQQRVITERADLDARRERLARFIGSATFDGLDPAERGRLTRQASIMADYSAVLDERIAAFKEPA